MWRVGEGGGSPLVPIVPVGYYAYYLSKEIISTLNPLDIQFTCIANLRFYPERKIKVKNKKITSYLKIKKKRNLSSQINWPLQKIKNPK